MRLLITGATSFIGSHVTRLLLERGHDLGILLRSSSDPWRIREALPRMRSFISDIAEVRGIESELASFAPEAVIHLAWHGVDRDRRDDREQISQNLFGTIALMETAQRIGCASWIGVGTQLETALAGRTGEPRPTASSLYAATKSSERLLTERLCRLHATRWVWLRLATTYGPMDHATRLIPYCILSLLNGVRPALTAGNQSSEFLFVTDVAEALCAAATNPGLSGEYDFGASERFSVRSVAERIRDQIDPELPLGFGELPKSGPEPPRLPAESGRPFSDSLPRTTLDEGLARTIEWFRTNLRRFA